MDNNELIYELVKDSDSKKEELYKQLMIERQSSVVINTKIAKTANKTMSIGNKILSIFAQKLKYDEEI